MSSLSQSVRVVRSVPGFLYSFEGSSKIVGTSSLVPAIVSEAMNTDFFSQVIVYHILGSTLSQSGWRTTLSLGRTGTNSGSESIRIRKRFRRDTRKAIQVDGGKRGKDNLLVSLKLIGDL